MEIANKSQAINGVDNNTIMTPLRVKQSIQANSVGGGGGANIEDYSSLSNKPKINNVELNGNKTTEELGINHPTRLGQLTNDVGYITSGDIFYRMLDEDLYLVDGELPNLEAGYYVTKNVYVNGVIDSYFTNALIYYDNAQTNPTITAMVSDNLSKKGYLHTLYRYNSTNKTWGASLLRVAVTNWTSIRSKPIVNEINDTTATDSNIPSALAVKNYIDNLLGGGVK